MPKLAQGVPKVKGLLKQQGLKEAYKINKTGIRDDQALVIQVDCKERKHWKMIDKVTLDGGARVDVISKRVRNS